ncbi:hypothetical protein Sango_0711800 [Sesamum angolense]|uniref:Lipoyl-binding domain-containing protein n=1 Tax=Sesamum angolense TaxID=2727404 RepID=A0AAE1X162_9LAMI|nr:hypothetical protein Sango_0711800 [Sesamum angolense]
MSCAIVTGSAVLKWIFDVFYYVTDAFTTRHGAILVSCVKHSETTVTSKSNSDPNGAVISDNQPNGLLEKKSPSSATFPNGLRYSCDLIFAFVNSSVWLKMPLLCKLKALLTEVCDETKIAELKLKFGPFQIHMKRNIDGPPVPAPVVPQTTAPPVPSKPANASAPAAPPSPPKSSLEKVSPFTNVSIEKVAKLAAIEASGATGYVIVSSPTVGSFPTLKGKKQPPACKEGDVIKEGQVIGFLDQFGTQLPVRSGVAGEVLKLLYNDGEAVGYGDPLIAVLPSFHGIK